MILNSKLNSCRFIHTDLSLMSNILEKTSLRVSNSFMRKYPVGNLCLVGNWWNSIFIILLYEILYLCEKTRNYF